MRKRCSTRSSARLKSRTDPTVVEEMLDEYKCEADEQADPKDSEEKLDENVHEAHEQADPKVAE